MASGKVKTGRGHNSFEGGKGPKRQKGPKGPKRFSFWSFRSLPSLWSFQLNQKKNARPVFRSRVVNSTEAYCLINFHFWLLPLFEPHWSICVLVDVLEPGSSSTSPLWRL